ncbi:amino acid ABC transporter ATP-binding protein [Arthrobacter sp. UYEF36]|uniref:amino acid ABC transporter ATP-binding protein n=1 Tax=Arthrobacter sp. UYEF36 TaxID=1756366 RepID=UPI003396A23D
MSLTQNPPLVLEAHQIKKSFGDHLVLNGIDANISRGDVLTLLGPSGSGKSTFLRCVNLLERPDSGSIRVNGELIGYREQGDKLHQLTDNELAIQRTTTGMVFQQFNLFGHLNALENVMLAPVLVRKKSKAEAREEAMALLARVGLQDRAKTYPLQLSGGQQQRVAIARALAMKPELMLFDEPTSALDPELVGEVLGVIKGLAEEGMSMMIVTHEIAFARSVSDQVMFMADGLVVERGTPEEVFANPKNPRTIQFLKEI